ncbi:alpha/beta hydrolase [Fuerstiella marisgermanici]|uniref:Putative esterase n=1 Tax=Fuerstiella marisgermanici TaxID=1891926 RepID=A0A1P8WGX7_9PLAN|nr:alpha/beta hydrolase [Fuerstiella marisgermanici]APZ93319.1 putative esterase [Fuerstiella marisgermanici]
MRILFLHGWTSVVGGRKPTFLTENGHELINPALPDEDFEESVRIAEAEHTEQQPDVIVGSSRGGAVAVNMKSRDTPLVLLCPAWKKWGTATIVKPNTIILHSRQDDVIPFTDSDELIANSGLPPESLVEVGDDHRLADEESLEAMLDACFNVCLPEWSEEQKELLEQDWDALCYSAAMRWITATKDSGWQVVHGTVFSGELEKRIEHAWCELGDIIVDLAMHPQARVIDRYSYYRTIQPEVSKMYSADNALMLSLRNGHQGPWDESEQLPPDEDSILDHPAISGKYLFPQDRFVDDPFLVDVQGAELACFRKIVDPDGFTMIHFHGNGEAVADYLPYLADWFAEMGLNSLFIEYRQYGGSSGEARLVAMLGDGEAAMKAAGIVPEKVIVFGRSIGSLYAIELADRQPTIAGLIIESGIANPSERFLTYADLESAGLKEADVLTEVELYFSHQMKLLEYENPLLILHTEEDGLIDISHAERNYEWSGSSQKQLVRFPNGNHNTIFRANLTEYMNAVADFMRSVQS